MSNSNRKVVKYKKPISLNIGLFVFAILLLYIVICVFLYFSKEQLTLYEVTEKKISDNNFCQGIILRDESIINSEKDGFINYYVREGERVSKNSIIYSIDQNGEVYDMLSNTETEDGLTAEETGEVRASIATFRNEYQNSNYNYVYDYKYDIENTILELSNINMLSNLQGLINDGSVKGSFDVINTTKSGIISYTTDGMEGIKKDDITEATMDNSKYERKQLRTSDAQPAGSPIYKIITDENWSIVISLTEEQYKKVSEKERIKITFLKDNLTTAANITSYKRDNAYYATLTLNKYMVRYLADRYIDIELSLNSAEGLKIPITSIKKKDFYVIPLAYMTSGGKDGSDGVIKETYDKNGTLEYTFVAADKYFEDEKYVYIDTNVIEAGSFIDAPSDDTTPSKERYEIKEVATLEGVYNVNKGYSVFRRVEKEYENSEYCIVKPNTTYGISVYDHIVLNAALVKEQKIIY